MAVPSDQTRGIGKRLMAPCFEKFRKTRWTTTRPKIDRLFFGFSDSVPAPETNVSPDDLPYAEQCQLAVVSIVSLGRHHDRYNARQFAVRQACGTRLPITRQAKTHSGWNKSLGHNLGHRVHLPDGFPAPLASVYSIRFL